MKGVGKLTTPKSIEAAQREILDWLGALGIMLIDFSYDARSNVARITFKYLEKNYEFRSTKQLNCRLNMWAIARAMEYKVRAHGLGIEDFSTSMVGHLQLEDRSFGASASQAPTSSNEVNYVKLGISPMASNDEIKKKYLELMKTFHPDMALSEGAKAEFEKRTRELNEAYSEIRKERGI